MKNFLYITLICFLAFSCKKKDTSWTTDWGAPIVSDTLTLSNFMNDSTLTSSDQATIDVDLTRTLLDIGIKDIIKIPDTTISQFFSPLLNINNVQPGFTFVNSIEEHTFDLNGIELKKIRTAKGKIKVKVYNPLATKVFYTIQLPGTTKNGVMFEQTYSVDAGSITQPQTSEEILDLSGYDLDLRGESGFSFNKLQSKLAIKTDPNGSVVSINSQHDFKFDGTLYDLEIDYAKGYFGNQVVSDTSTFQIPYFNNVVSGSIDIPATNLLFSIENGMKVSLKGKVTHAKNTNYSSNSVTLNSSEIGSDFYVSPATGSWSSLNPSQQTKSFNSTNSNIEQYIENLGSEHEIGYQFQLNPWGNVSGGADEIFPNSKIKVKVNLQMPLSLGADGLTLRDTFNFDLNQDPTKIHANSGTITLNATNAFPISCEPVLYFMDENNFILHTIIGSSQIPSSKLGNMNPQNGLFEKKSSVQFVLPETLVSDLSKIKFVLVEARFDTPNYQTGINEQQSIPFGAYLAVKLNIKLNGTIIY
ncbi:MAG: hypothetical protein ACOVQG_10395 [Crocinitomicaceae bacterium]